MAAGRMFNISFLQSDAFTEQSKGAQLLYIQLSLTADDDGFTESIRLAEYLSGTGRKELHELEENGFIIPFMNGKVFVVRHWKTNNHIRKDRYTPTKFHALKAQIKEVNGEYKLTDTNGIPVVYQTDTGCTPMDTNGIPVVNPDKISIDKYSIDKKEGVKNSPSPNEIIELYNSICVSLPKAEKLSEARRKTIKARLKEFSLDDIQTAFEKAEQSEFLKGGNDRRWKASFDWIMNPNNIVKILEGNYNKTGNQKAATSKNQFNRFEQNEYDFAALEDEADAQDYSVPSPSDSEEPAEPSK